MPESYPNVRAGQKVTGALLESMKPVTVRKASDTARTSTTPSADPELQFTVEANAVYTMEGVLYYDGSVDTTDIQIDWSAPTGSDGSWGAIGLPETDAGAANVNDTNVKLVGTTTITSARAYGVDNLGTGSPATLHVKSLLITGSTAGTYSLDWSVQSGEAGTITMLNDSWLALQRIA